ncbi:Crp/Fnr family transcriptional regulator [Leptotrichia sp. oral taxon 221]|uniref:Crp/Fnr family transcriptional regulator n=1 Tax=Leptotrichia sp. oral taxon 221 TaxID=712362 RepID=UPI001B8BA998|nr:Crp/Fnr family transcriptional regulator [Leptotrichia sp. oral taxon 221]QUB96789.1 Crp/Fnr family transcriptional regulator [Leptotrichia sp. oral taxon 221]
MKINNFYRLLKNIGIFRTFNEKQIENIFSKIHYQIKDYPKNELVFFRGDTINHIIIILEGLCKGEMQKLNGDSIVIDYIPSQQIVAPAFIFGDVSTFPVDLITVEKTKLLFLDKNDFLELLQTDKTLLINFINEISNKGQLLSKRIWFNFTNKTITEKIISYVKQNQKNGIITFYPNISELAKKFEITRPSLSREISSLCNKGFLTKISNNQYRVDLSVI